MKLKKILSYGRVLALSNQYIQVIRQSLEPNIFYGKVVVLFYILNLNFHIEYLG